MRGNSIKNIALALLVLIGFGIVRLPLEEKQEALLRDSHFRDAALDLSLADQIGQRAFVASLGGYRALVASILELETYDEFVNQFWAKLDLTYKWIHSLQPRSYHYWDTHHWHMAANAASWYRYEAKLPEEEAGRLHREYVMRGVEVAEKGLENLPGEYRLYALLARVYDGQRDNPLQDPCMAAKYYREVIKSEAAPKFYRRFHAYRVADCGQDFQEAYNLLRGLYDEGPRQRKPRLISLLKYVEEKLSIPPTDRIPEEDPLAPK